MTYRSDYMTPALLHVCQKIYKTGAYLYRNPRKPGLHFITIDKPAINTIYEFGVPDVRRQVLLHFLQAENLHPSLLKTELLLRGLPVIQY